MNTVRESKRSSKLELFYRLFIEVFLHLFGPWLKHIFERSLKLLRVPSETLSCYLSKITPKSNCKHVPADGVERAQKRKCLLLLRR